MAFRTRHLLSIDLLGGGSREEARDEIADIVYEALEMVPFYTQDKVCPVEFAAGTMMPEMAALFSEISTRTLGSSMAAGRRVGFSIVDPILPGQSSLGKGETWANTVRMVNQQGVQVLVIRSEIEGLGLHLAQCLEETATPEDWVRRGMSIIVGGAGTRDHPTQVLLDITTIVLRKLGIRHMDEWPKINAILSGCSRDELKLRICEIMDNLKMAFVGDLRHSRVVHDWIHLAQWFNIRYTLIAPDLLQVEPWCIEGSNFVTGSRLEDALLADFLYSIRIQLSRLGSNIPEYEARRVILSLQITPAFIKIFPGEIMDAQPVDNNNPAILPEVQGHEKVIMRMQSAVGIPLRMAVINRCYRNRRERFDTLNVPEFTLQPEDVLKYQGLESHWAELAERYRDKAMFFTRVENGIVIDRIPPGGARVIDLINQRAGLYYSGRGQIVLAREVDSQVIAEGKEVIFLHNRWPPLELAAVYGLLFPSVRLSWMTTNGGDRGYQRLQLRLPEVVAGIFRCANKNCVTNHDPECETHFVVMGSRGNAGVKCSFCQHHYSVENLIGGGMSV